MTQTNELTRQHLPKKKGLDMLKGIAISGIFLYHLIPSVFPGGFLGVPLFFCSFRIPDVYHFRTLFGNKLFPGTGLL